MRGKDRRGDLKREDRGVERGERGDGKGDER